MERKASYEATKRDYSQEDGMAVKNNRRKMSAYERSLDDERNGRMNRYASSEEFFGKMKQK